MTIYLGNTPIAGLPDTSNFATKTELNTKADKNEIWTPSSSTSAQRDLIIDWGMPNYAAIIDIPLGSYNTSFHCLLVAENNANAHAYVGIGSKTIMLNGAYGTQTAVCLYIPKGVRFDTSGSFAQLWIVPLKGIS